MSSLEKNKKRKKSKKKNTKKKKNETEGEVLERVMDSIEMAGASMDFFDGDAEPQEVEEPEILGEAIEAADAEEVEETLEASDTTDEEFEALGEEETPEEMEASTDDELEASAEETPEEIPDDAETVDMLPEEVADVNFIEQKQAFSIIESLLFSSERPLGLGTFKQVFKGTNYKTKEIKKALEEMQSEYADQSRGVTLEEINGGWQLRTKVDNMDFLRKLAKARPFKLSGPALEVLAIIAYKQPLVKSEVDEIRGVESGHLVRALMEKHLVCFQGKSELPGKPMQYGTTRKFLEIFGLRNLRELPSLDEIDQLLPDGIGIEEEDEKLSDVTASMSEDYQGNYSEGEEELEKIEGTLSGIDTSSEFFEEEKRRQKEKRDRDKARDIREALDVGEEVEAKDQRWLERYEAKQAELAAAAEAESSVEDNSEVTQEMMTEEGLMASTEESMEASEEEPGSLIEEPESLTDEFSQMMADNLVEPEVLAADDQMESDDEDILAELSDEEDTEVVESEPIEDAETFDPFEEGSEEEYS